MTRQFDIHWVNLDPSKGVETRKARPCAILSNDLTNKGKLIFVAPLLKSGNPQWPFVVPITKSDANQLDQDRLLDLRQTRSIDQTVRLGARLGRLETQYHKDAIERLQRLF